MCGPSGITGALKGQRRSGGRGRAGRACRRCAGSEDGGRGPEQGARWPWEAGNGREWPSGAQASGGANLASTAASARGTPVGFYLQDSKTATPCPFGPLHLRPPSWQCGGGDAALDGARLPPLAVSPRAGGSPDDCAPDDCAPRWTTDRPQTGRADTDAALTFPSVLSWKLSTRAASVHLAATSRAAFRRRSWGDGQGGGSAQGMSVRAQASRKCRPAAPAGSPPPPRLRACTDAPR